MSAPTSPGPAGLLAQLADDPDQGVRVRAIARGHAAAILHRVSATRPPLQHAMPVLALAYAVAGLARLTGDPGLIDLVAARARDALHRDEITVHDLHPSQD